MIRNLTHGFVRPRPGVVLLVGGGLLTGDALVRDRGAFDYALVERVRSLQGPGVEMLMDAARRAFEPWALAGAWVALLCFVVVRRDWIGAVLAAVVPAILALAWLLRELVGREGPDPARIGELDLTSPSLATFPNGDVFAVTLLFGLVFILAAEFRAPLRLVGRVAAVVIAVLMGLAPVWHGLSWTGDALASYAFGGATMLLAATVYRTSRPYVAGLPLVRAGAVPHDATVRHAHALTSTIVFGEGTATKVYNPGFLPRAIYWSAFQAPFAYAHNPIALRAAVLRRNLAGKLTEYWYGENRVARALGIADYHGRQGIVGQFIPGDEPHDHAAASAFLFDLTDRFDAAGLPTWQVDPRQPRALGNIIETPDGRYMVIDLESGLVSPMASPRAWRRAFRRGLVPLFDDVFFDVTRTYVAREEQGMRARLGDSWYEELRTLLASAEESAAAWHGTEPRVWSRIVRAFWSGLGVITVTRRVRAIVASGEEHAVRWVEESIVRWEDEGRLQPGDAEALHQSARSPEFQAVLPHFGVHLAIGVVLRFPLGSIARVAYTGSQLGLSTVRLLTRRIDRPAWRRSLRIHSPLVLLVAGMPAVGTFSYMVSPTMRGQRDLARVSLDAVGEKVPWHLYERSHVRRLIAGRSVHESSGSPSV